MWLSSAFSAVQVSGAWLLYKSSTDGKGFLSATLQGFTVFDDREGVEKEFRLAIGKPENVGASLLNAFSHQQNQDSANSSIVKENGFPVPTMLIVDVKFAQDSTFVSLCIQRPQLLVALDFLLAVVEFFVPTVSIDNETFDHFIYDGHGGTLYLKDGQGFNLTEASSEALIYVGSGKKLQFKNVVVKGGQYLDSCVLLGANSSYSVSKEDNVYLEDFEESPSERSLRGNILDELYQSNAVNNSTELIIELQVKCCCSLVFVHSFMRLCPLVFINRCFVGLKFDIYQRVNTQNDP
ncbi:uncharacterized protein DS421_3g84030 [Arachis hypogaea]|nr:uncharacterized protein DS421_3g84030 [Arachis hypogaea]